VAPLARSLLGCWNSCILAVRNPGDGCPADEAPSTQNCWSWSLKKFLYHKRGRLVIEFGPRRVLRCMWQDGDVLWHFEPVHPKRGVAGIWHSFLHKGVPKRMR
jgi:hypothetical protein